MWAKEVFEVRQIPQACLVSLGVLRIIPLEIPWTLWIWLKSVSLIQGLLACQCRWCRVFDNSILHEVLLVFWRGSRNCLCKSKQLYLCPAVSQQNSRAPFHVGHGNLPCTHQPMNSAYAGKSCVEYMYQARIMNFFAKGVVCLEPIIPSFLQFVLKQLHVHIHILPRIVGPWNYQRQENVLSLHNLPWRGD